MPDKKLNQNGFTLIEALLIIIAVSLLAFVGYYVWHNQQQATKTYSSANTIAQNTPSNKSSVQQKYLTIQEWGVKLPLSTTDAGAYYTAPTTDALGQDIALFDTSIDKTNNANGVNCKNPDYPLFVITRVKTSDVATSTDGNSPNFIVETNASMFKEFSFDKTYSYAGRPIHQSPPVCSDLNPAGDYKEDTAVSDKYSVIDNALTRSFEGMRAQ